MPKIDRDTLYFILTEMFNRVGKEYTEEATQDREWFLQTTWTKEEQTEFTYWLRDFLRSKYHITKNKANNEAAWFVLNYGWRTDIDRKETTTKQEEEA